MEFNKILIIVSLVAVALVYCAINKQKKEQDRLKKKLNTLIPKKFNYSNISGLKKEAALKLSEIKPENLEYASRIQGVTPADIQLILFHIYKR